jgi:hypothetical protein
MKQVVIISKQDAKKLKGEIYHTDEKGRVKYFNPQEDEDGVYYVSEIEANEYLGITEETKKKKFAKMFTFKTKDHKPK